MRWTMVKQGTMRGLLLAVALLAGCAPTLPPLPPGPHRTVPQVAALPRLPPREAAANFVAAVSRVEPVAEAYCRARTRGVPCDFRIVIDDRGNQPPNAFQTLDQAGRPVIGFTLALVATARNVDELAFVLGHESAHHILGHIPASLQTAQAGAILAGMVAQAGGADPEAVRAASDLGGTIAARRYSKEFELQADALGAEIAYRAGFDPLLGAQYFSRLPDPGDRFLGSHPPNAQRLALVRKTVAGLR